MHERVHLDFAGPFPSSMFLVAVNAYSKWPEVKVMSTTTVSAMLDVLRECSWYSGTTGDGKYNTVYL